MTHIPFKANIGKNKPNTLINREFKCPFCDRIALRKEGRVISETDEFLIVKNKFPVIENTFPTVIVEHNSCDEHIGTYSIDYLTRLLKFSLDFYNDLESSGSYKSVLFMKNHGIFSGGSIKHPHMQIIGFTQDSYKENLKDSDYEGVNILSNELIDWNFSNKPRSEFYEINLTLKDKTELEIFATYLQKSVNFTLKQLNKKYKCYNLAFQINEDSITVKIISRGPTSILLLGFGIHQTPNNLEQLAEQLREF